MSRHLGGAYGLVYSFKVSAPPGSRVRVSFSPAAGRRGWSAFTEAVVGKDGMVVTTLPFGGVFHPVELLFQLR